MSLIKWSPRIDPFQEMDELMNTFLPATAGGRSFIPAVDMYETKDAVVIETPLAGIEPKDVSVRVEGDMLIISGETRREREVDEKNYYRKEVRSGSFSRALHLPGKVDAEAVKAEYENGVLKITAPKMDDKKTKTIEVEIKKN